MLTFLSEEDDDDDEEEEETEENRRSSKSDDEVALRDDDEVDALIVLNPSLFLYLTLSRENIRDIYVRCACSFVCLFVPRGSDVIQ
jgi:hypothetical protein